MEQNNTLINKKEKLKKDFDLKVDSDKSAILDRAKNSKNKFKKFIQRTGSFMAGMIMPIVSILIAWGLLAAMFLGSYQTDSTTGESVWVATGWFDFEPMGQLISPGMKWLIPILIGFIAGNMIYGIRGGTLGAWIVFVAIVGNDFIYSNYASDWMLGANPVSKVGSPNQIVGAMILSPLFVWIGKKLENTYLPKIRPGYEMLVRNFSLAFICIGWAFVIFFSWGFIMYGITWIMVSIIEGFSKAPWAFPFMAIFTEPLRAIFLNNALNWGVMIPLGLQEVDTMNATNPGSGFSQFFMVGGNPGPGFGLLIAYVVWRKQQRTAAGGSSLIQLVGGIHEVHYVYILAEPIMILATISGAFVSLLILKLLAGGAIAAISPGSIISVIAMSGTGYRIAINVFAIFAGAITSFAVATLIMIFQKKSNKIINNINLTDEGITFEDNIESSPLANQQEKFEWKNAKLLMVACDAGVGSSAMAAGIIKKWVKNNNIDIEVKNCAVKDLPKEADIIVTMKNFIEVAHDKNPNAFIYPVDKFLGDGIFDNLYQKLLENKLKIEESK